MKKSAEMKKSGINLQVYMDKRVKEKSEKIAKENGFDNLQDLVRFFLHQVANGAFVPSVKIEENKNSVTFKHEESMSFESTNRNPDDLQISYTHV